MKIIDASLVSEYILLYYIHMQISRRMATQYAIAVKVERCSRLWTFEIHTTAYNRSKHHIKGCHGVEWGNRIRNHPKLHCNVDVR